jgi:hypothetical protein
MKANETLQNELRAIELESGFLSDFISVEDFTQDADYYLNLSDDDFKEEIYNLLDEQGAFYIEIVYYNNAIDYLRRYDFSLTLSLELAEEAGYKLTDLNSEILASLLASDTCRLEFNETPGESFRALRISLANYLESLTTK